MSFVVLGHDDASAGVFIEAMNDAGSFFAANCGERTAMAEERIHQRMLLMSCPGMNHQSGRFVQPDQVVIFEHTSSGMFSERRFDRSTAGSAIRMVSPVRTTSRGRTDL